jgi:hypothetical protein
MRTPHHKWCSPDHQRYLILMTVAKSQLKFTFQRTVQERLEGHNRTVGSSQRYLSAASATKAGATSAASGDSLDSGSAGAAGSAKAVAVLLLDAETGPKLPPQKLVRRTVRLPVKPLESRDPRPAPSRHRLQQPVPLVAKPTRISSQRAIRSRNARVPTWRPSRVPPKTIPSRSRIAGRG